MKYLAAGYVAFALLLSPFYWLFGDYGHKSYSYNLGKAFVWPVTLFSSSPELDGSSGEAFDKSFDKLIQPHVSGDGSGVALALTALATHTALEYAKDNKNFTSEDFKKVSLSNLSKNFATGETKLKVIKKLDGMDFGDLVRSLENADENLIQTLLRNSMTAPLTPIAQVVSKADSPSGSSASAPSGTPTRKSSPSTNTCDTMPSKEDRAKCWSNLIGSSMQEADEYLIAVHASSKVPASVIQKVEAKRQAIALEADRQCKKGDLGYSDDACFIEHIQNFKDFTYTETSQYGVPDMRLN